MISIDGLTKTYAGGFEALKNIHLEIYRGEIFALLGPNGAGKTTLINAVCGIRRRDIRISKTSIGYHPKVFFRQKPHRIQRLQDLVRVG